MSLQSEAVTDVLVQPRVAGDLVSAMLLSVLVFPVFPVFLVLAA